MTTREQLEYCAKACGIELHSDNDTGDGGLWVKQTPIPGVFPTHYRAWNPLTNIADCANAEAQLGIDVNWFNGEVMAEGPWFKGMAERNRFVKNFKDHNNDKQAARMAAVCAVLEQIGRSM